MFLNALALLGDFFDDNSRCLVNTTLQAHGVCPGRNVLQALAINRFGQQRCRSRSVASNIAGLARDFANHLCAHVLKRIGKLNFLCNRNTILGDRR